ncbi:hypothetical protein [Methylibium sp.]|uniref:hypothetical protein n=1 Tax=Methylibium sp. TaxID=2067992 RepID=UPI0017E83FE6|nr:hypothetical protein [Methylibium sp.]MBA3588492.1 hypothetical protein [Methylibium sp.]
MRKPKIGRPPLPPGERRVTLTVRVRPATKAEAARRAKAHGTSQGEETDRAFGA